LAALGAYPELSAGLPADFCFPNRLEDVLILTAAIRTNPRDARAPYYLGNFWYAHRRHEEAIAAWEQARALDDRFPTVHRNLGLAYYNKLKQPQLALLSLETAFELNPSDGRVLFELDQLYRRVNRPPAERLAFLEQHEHLVAQRDDLTFELINLLNLLHRPQDALDLLMRRNFHPWEGGEGKVTRQYVITLVELGRQCIKRGAWAKAIQYLSDAQIYPLNLGEGKLAGALENNIHYYLGIAYQGLGEPDRAKEWFLRATEGSSQPGSAMFYNDQPPDMIFYQGLAHQLLGHVEAAEAIFQKLVAYGQKHMNDEVEIDYFAISLPDFLVFEEDLNVRNTIHCHYMIALGKLGLGEEATAQSHFEYVLNLENSHLGAVLHEGLIIQ
ncbi:MAG: tetratricopeptide repeat protein, partial [bacterium]